MTSVPLKESMYFASIHHHLDSLIAGESRPIAIVSIERLFDAGLLDDDELREIAQKVMSKEHSSNRDMHVAYVPELRSFVAVEKKYLSSQIPTS